MAKVKVVDYGPFELEVGSAAYERLVDQEKIDPRIVEVREVDIKPDEALGDDEVTEPAGEVVKLDKLNRSELDERAESLGVQEPGKLASKADVIAAIEASVEAGETLND